MNRFQRELNQALDLNLVLQQFARYAQIHKTRVDIQNAKPLKNPLEIKYLHQNTKEGKDFLQKGMSVSLFELEEIETILEAAKKGRILDPAQLLVVEQLLENAQVCRKVFGSEFGQLHELANGLDLCPKLDAQLKKALDTQGKIKSDASARLIGLHERLRELQQRMSSRSREFIRNHSAQLMDTIATSYNSRVCFLVKTNYKNSFGGMVHGSSQSGAAFYVEPSSFVGLNNDIASVKAEIEEEYARICRELSRMVQKEVPVLKQDLDIVSELDLALAKGRWILENDGSVPVMLQENREIRLIHARHPLIEEKRAVFNDYILSPQFQILMISGPNMGGKSVTIKTIGLFAILAHAGFPVIAHEARIPFYETFFLDLSDAQSIQENLSTFSGHISKVSRILQRADEHSLVILDELGHGTDPLEGSALAQAVLEDLLKKKATVLTTTHYDQVKSFGKGSDQVLVSSVEFDQKTLKPTYRFLPHSSAASYAFDIAGALNVSSEILERARFLKEELQSENHRQLERLEKMQNDAWLKEQEFEKRLRHLHQLQREVQEQKDAWNLKKETMEQEFRDQLNAQLKERKESARKILKEIKTEKRKSDAAYLDQLDSLMEDKQEEPEIKESFQKGDYVVLSGLNMHGEIVELSKKKATVASNGKKISVSLDAMTKIPRPGQKAPSKYQERKFTRFPLELNLIGMRVEEGLNALDQYLDQAVVHNIKNARIIHGMGTGKLRSAVWKDLKSRSNIKKIEAAGPNQGGLGATLIEFK